MADELRIGLQELLRKAQVEGEADFLREDVRALSQAIMEMASQTHLAPISSGGGRRWFPLPVCQASATDGRGGRHQAGGLTLSEQHDDEWQVAKRYFSAASLSKPERKDGRSRSSGSWVRDMELCGKRFTRQETYRGTLWTERKT